MRFFLIALISVCLSACGSKEVRPITQADADAINFPSDQVQSKVDLILPYALEQNSLLQAHALNEGTPLNAEGIELARQLGVKRPERVRILVVDKIPKFRTADRLVKTQAEIALTATIAGITSGYGIYIAKSHEDKIWVLAHELVHVAQFERWGFEETIRRVVTEQVALPGRLIPVEREAIETSARILRIDPPGYAF